MKRSLAGAGLFALALVIQPVATPAQQLYPPPFQIRPAPPEIMPTVSPYSDVLDNSSGTSRPDIAATPNCGAANPQGGIPSMVTGTCP